MVEGLRSVAFFLAGVVVGLVLRLRRALMVAGFRLGLAGIGRIFLIAGRTVIPVLLLFSTTLVELDVLPELEVFPELAVFPELDALPEPMSPTPLPSPQTVPMP